MAVSAFGSEFDPVNIQLDKLKTRPREIIFSEPYTDFPSLVQLVDQSGLEFNAQVSGRLNATWAGDVVEVAGTMTTVVTLPCSRCLDEVVVPVDVEVMLVYSHRAETGEVDEDTDLELDEDALGLIPIEGDEIDLHPELENEVIMALPQKPLCKTDCAGLCPVCGNNLNHSGCHCDRPQFHSGLDALKKLKLD